MSEFLYIDGIRGNATEANHRGEFELTSVAFPGNKPSASSPEKDLKLREMGVTKNVDSASTSLYKAAMSGQIFGSMILDLVRPGGTSRLTLSMVSLANMQLDERQNESFNLVFERISYERV